VLSIIAGTSDFAADISLTFLGGLWLLWLISRSSQGNVFAHTSTGTSTSAPSGEGKKAPKTANGSGGGPMV
jgi:hypothetical protein